MSNRPEPGTQGWCIEIVVGGMDDEAEEFALFEAALDDPAERAAVSRFRNREGRGWTFRSVRASRPDAAELRSRLDIAAAVSGMQASSVSVVPLPAVDWVAEVNRRTPPVSAGRFFVRGSHATAKPPAGGIEIVLDAGRAFGTGSHESTRGCLLALDRMQAPGNGTILDLGTGSGILAIAAAKRWRRSVLAADIDPVSVATARENAGLNGVDPLVETRASRGFSNPRLRARAPYSLIAANILADPLIRLAPAIARYLRHDGHAILSGLLKEQEAEVAAAYESVGFPVRDRHPIEAWTTLVVGRDRSRRYVRRRGAA